MEILLVPKERPSPSQSYLVSRVVVAIWPSRFSSRRWEAIVWEEGGRRNRTSTRNGVKSRSPYNLEVNVFFVAFCFLKLVGTYRRTSVHVPL
jgi:hypothetical protein